MLTLRPYQKDALDKLKRRLKETDVPLLVNASVGSGKSLIIAELLLLIERAGWRALCLTMNSTLIRQNAEAYKRQGGHAGIYCAALKQKDTDKPVVFASPMSILKGIKSGHPISMAPFNLIVIDESHNINISDPKTTYMKIFNWYEMLSKHRGHKIRFVGLTGTPYRGRGHTIVGDDQFFKEEVCAISAEWLIDQGYLMQPIWGTMDAAMQYDYSTVKMNALGHFDAESLKASVKTRPRLTAKIMQEVQNIVKRRRGAFIFATSIEHCCECMCWLPKHESAMITGDTPDHLRATYLSRAREGEIKYLVNVNVLCTGVDVPAFDTVVFVRPTESLVLYMQCLGRGLRLYDGKTDCLVLDYAGNLERHGDIDNPIINEAIKQKIDDDPEYCIPCYTCKAFNKVTARRCIGTIQDRRCDHYFEFKECIKCAAMNDITARFCRACKTELIDPNEKLKATSAGAIRQEFNVLSARYWIIMHQGNHQPIFCAKYLVNDGKRNVSLGESFSTKTTQTRNIFYGRFVKQHFYNPTDAYIHLDNPRYLEAIIQNGHINTPQKILAIPKDDGGMKIVKKLF